jgi:hypothetical protein
MQDVFDDHFISIEPYNASRQLTVRISICCSSTRIIRTATIPQIVPRVKIMITVA